MKRRENYTIASPQRGLAAVEFLIGLPVLLFIAFAIAEVGQLMTEYNTLHKSVRDGARFVVSNASVGTTRIVNLTTQLRDQTRNLVVKGNINGTGTPILQGLTLGNVTVTASANGFITVAATYAYSPILANTLPTFGFGNSIDLAMTMNATVVMRAL